MIKNIDEFLVKLTKYKEFRLFSERYKTNKFLKLYLKIYNYIFSIPKEKIIRSNSFRCMINYISKFIEVKDFYHWKYRIYSLMTEKINPKQYKHYELLYRSKAKKYFNNTKEKQENTCIEKYGTKYPSQSKQWKDHVKNKWKNKSKEEKEQHLDNIKKGVEKKYGPGITNVYQAKEIKEKCIAKHIENLGVDHPMHSKEIVNKVIIKKLELYSNIYGPNTHSFHSKFGDEVCTAIDNLLGNPEDSIYYAKSGYEYCISSNDRNYCIDMVIPSLKLAFEADGVYFHGLIEGQEYVYNTPVEEIHKKDKEKSEAIEKAGYKLFRIREDEYRKNPENYLINILYPRILEYVNRSSF